MRLLHLDDDDNISLVEYFGKNVPPYAILSHTWGADHAELTFKDLIEGAGKDRDGYRKLMFCGKQAVKDSLHFFWVDTVCIDKSSSAELQEAINSMFRWYQTAEKCYVYMSDVSTSDIRENLEPFRKSRWFTRGWTLQELIAPTFIEFYSVEGDSIGDKTSLMETLHSITKIPVEVLEGSPLSSFSIEERMSWAEDRNTKREEDAAYSLLGIFGVHMPLIYGEGHEHAISRLKRKINKLNGNDPSTSNPSTTSILQADFDFDTISPLSNDRKHIHGHSWPFPENVSNAYKVEVADSEQSQINHCQLQALQDMCDQIEEKDLRQPVISGLVSQEQIQRESIQEIHRLLPSLRYQADKNELARVNDWLDVTNFNDQYNVTQFYDRQVSSRLVNTCEWIFSHSAYCDWILEGPQKLAKILWIYAPAGHGKSVLCARVVQHLETMDSKTTAYFFSSPHAQSGGTPEFIVRSWIAQIGQHDADVLYLVKSNSKLGRRASESAIWSTFASIVASDRSYVFVLDGFDEYSRADNARSRFLQKLKKSVDRTRSRILITSRNDTDIDSELSEEAANDRGVTVIRCKITKNDLSHDISLFSKSLVDERLPRKDERFRQELASQLAEKCQGMFLWVEMQQDQLRGGKNTKQLQKIVNNMPAGLIKTYERNWNTIQNLHHEDRINALTILKWVALAFRPLRVLDIAQALVVHYNEGVVTVRHDDLPDEIDEDYINGEILDICAGLVEVRSENTKASWTNKTMNLIHANKTLHLIHASVRDFLLSGPVFRPTKGSRLETTPDYPTTHIEEHFELATVCLGYLNDLDFWPHREECGDFGHKHTFTCYAATHWHLHVIAVGQDSPELLRLMKAFFQSENMAFRRWCRYVECLAGVEYKDDEDEPYDNLASPLYYSALLNLPTLMEEIWLSDKTQLNRLGGSHGTPLQAVCFMGHDLAFELLVKWGASPTVEGGYFQFAIHAAIVGGYEHIVESLITLGTSLELEDSRGQTPLSTAAYYGNTKIVRLLLEAGAEKDVKDCGGYTPIHIAAKWGNLEVVKLLLEWGIDTTIANDQDYIPLDSATERGQPDIVKLLVECDMTHTQINSSDRTGYSLLHSAAYAGHVEVLSLLLDCGADVSVVDRHGETPLFGAVRSGKSEAAILLLDKGADIQASDDRDETSLHVAVASGNIKLVRLLVENGAIVEPGDVSSKGAWTPLMTAVYEGYLDIMEFLCENGANLAATTKNKETPLSVATGYCCPGNVIKFLLERGADWTVVDSKGRTVLWNAAARNMEEIIKPLLEGGVDWTIADKKGRTPLWAAARSGNAKVVKLLLDKGADWTIADGKGYTPLWVAARYGHDEAVKALLDKRTDCKIPDINNNWPALNVAARYGRLEIVNLLLERGASMIADKEGYTPLNRAAEENRLEIVKLLLEHGAEMTADNTGWTPLNNAANAGHFEVVKLLLEHGAQMTGSSSGRTPLITAAENGYLGIVELLLKYEGSTTAVTHDGWTALSAAAQSGHIETVRTLFDVTVDFGHAVPRFGTLWSVFAYQGYTDLLRSGYQKQHADFDLVNALGQTCLHMAARNGHTTTVKYFLSLGLQFPEEDAKGDGPLSYASSGGCSEMVEILLERISKVPFESKNWTPLHWACRQSNAEVVELLIKAGFRSKCVAISESEAKWSPVSVALFHNNSEMLEDLSELSRTLLSVEGEDTKLPGQPQSRSFCDGCFHMIYGPRFHCNVCPEGVNYCLMCEPFLASLPVHNDHKWTIFEPCDEPITPEHSDDASFLEYSDGWESS